MPYYGGGYYGGGYYGGGLFGNLWRGITHTVGGAIGGFITGGPKGAIGGAIGGAISATKKNIASTALEAGGSETAYTPAMRAKHALALVRGGAGGGAPIRGSLPLQTMAPAPMQAFGGQPIGPPAVGVAMRRSHWNRSTYVIRGGGTSRWGPAGQLQLIEKGTVPVPNRRMNVANPRALRRALRRVGGFGKLTHRARRAIARAASAVGIHRGGRGKKPARAPSVRVVKG